MKTVDETVHCDSAYEKLLKGLYTVTVLMKTIKGTVHCTMLMKNY